MIYSIPSYMLMYVPIYDTVLEHLKKIARDPRT